MSSYKTFEYSDNLTSRVYSSLPNNLQVTGENDPEILLIIRLLSGNLELIHSYTSKSIKSRINYFSGDFKAYSNWKTEFPKTLSDEVSADDISTFIEKNKFNNRAFYKGVLSELSQFILHENKKSHTSAFIYLYRLLEKISYAFPLIYASKSNDFLRSFKELQDLMAGDKDKKELGFFKTFVQTLYAEDSISETSIDLAINSNNDIVKKQVFDSLKKITPSSGIHGDTSSPDLLCIKYCEMGSFIISLRNRFFHNLNGGATNIKSETIVDSDDLFKFVNPMAMYWIATIFLGVTSHNLSTFQTLREEA
ncbi:MAG: hypothetical protein ACI88H_003319 [Cocleimonas sp.]|jgi:hypothetical protein